MNPIIRTALFVLGLALNTTLHAQSENNTFDTFLDLYNKKEFARLEAFTETSQSNPFLIPILSSLKGEYELSNKQIRQLNLQHLNHNELKKMLQLLRVQNYFQLFQYSKALESVETSLHLNELSDDERHDLTNMKRILHALKKKEVQEAKFTGNITVNAKRDLAGLLRVPVAIHQQDFQFVFDTGANLSVITKSNAEQGKLEILTDSIEVKAVTGNKVMAQLGWADQLSIGNFSVSHVPFLIFPDEALVIMKGVYSIPGIIGLPVIRQMEDISILPSHDLAIQHSAKQNTSGANLYFDENSIAVKAEAKDTVRVFFLDLGAKASALNTKASSAFGRELSNTETKKLGGAGGSIEIETGEIKSATFTISGVPLTLSNVPFYFNEKTGSSSSKYFGVMGSDLVKKTKGLRLDFVNRQLSINQ